MKQFFNLFFVALFTSAFTLLGYTYFFEKEEITIAEQLPENQYIPTNLPSSEKLTFDFDFTEAAEKTVHAVVHVKNTTISRRATSISDYFFGGGEPRAMVGSGSGVIISPDGFIITNNHVIANSSQLEVTLNNNKTYEAELIGTDPSTDIALIKINSSENLPFIPFGDSNHLKIGEWVLAVGNPFNLTSTVTAGIISAKARDLNEFDGNPQSFIQTDAAVNRGNSGGALVNVKGELIGINTAITSETGSYVGYSFAVPSNNARKVIEDIMEFGGVQKGILGIRGGNLNSEIANEFEAVDGLHEAQIKNGIVSLKMSDVSKINVFDSHLFLDTGSPHHVQMVTNLEEFDVENKGAHIRNSVYGKEGSNINFVESIDDQLFAVRTYERGVEAETFSCGTGVTAVAISMFETNKTKSNQVRLATKGGVLTVRFIKNENGYSEIFLEGPAELMFKGTWV